MNRQQAEQYADRFERLMAGMVRQGKRQTFPKGHPPRSQFMLLKTLVASGPLSVSELAEVLEATPPAASSLVSELVKAGWAKRNRDTDDRRIQLVEVTLEGRSVLERARREHKARAIEVLKHFEPPEIEAFLRTTEKFLELVRKHSEEEARDATPA